jgi:hypothetical protein
MDCIYAGAELTIVAAAGGDAHYGLPGISTRARSTQHSLNLGDIRLVQIFPDTNSLESSTWSSRAWTIQEGFLSRRRLIFMDHQVSFLCNKMHCAESIPLNLKAPVNDQAHGLKRPNGYPALGSPSTVPRDPQQTAVSLMLRCSAADISFDSDALNVCLGILKYLNIHHWWGMFVRPIGDNNVKTINLEWWSGNPGRRRRGFPSWSWTSVAGRYTYMEPCLDQPRGLCVIKVPLLDGSWRTVDDWMESGAAVDALSDQGCLKITGSILKPHFVDDLSRLQIFPSHYQYRLMTILRKKIFAVFDFVHEGWQGSTVTALDLDDMADTLETLSDVVGFVWNPGSQKLQTTPKVILLKPTDDGYKRIGIATWPGGWNIFGLKHHGVSRQPVNEWNHLLPIPLPPKIGFLLW